MDNEEEAEDTDDHVAKAVQKGGGQLQEAQCIRRECADRVALLLKYDMEFGSLNPVRRYVTPNNVRLGDWLHKHCKKYKDGRLSESRVKTLNGIGVQFEKQRNVVGKRYTMATTISAIQKYEKEHGHIKVKKMENPHLNRWIMHAKAVSATIIEKGYGKDKFTLPGLISLHKLGLIVLPHKFKPQPEIMQKGTESGNVLVEKIRPLKLRVTKLVEPTKTRKMTQKAPTKMRKITQKVTTLATRSSPRKNKPS
jgi:hypothetical protein